MFGADMMDAMVPVYLERREQCTDPRVSPLFGDYTGLPPLLLVVGSTELLLDDAVRVAQRWPRSTLLVWHGMPHVFPGFDFLPEAREATERIGRFVRERLAAAAEAAAPEAAESAPSPQAPPHPMRRLSPQAQLWLALAVLSGLLWLAVVGIGIAPLLLLVNPFVWVAAFGLGTLWLWAVFLFLRATLGAHSGRRRGRG